MALEHAADVNVVIVHWPRERDRARRLEEAGIPRLLLVGVDDDPPDVLGCDADWIRLPADDRDIYARVRTISARAAQHPSRPEWRDGRIYFRGRAVTPSATESQIAAVLIEGFGRIVDVGRLADAAWPDGSANDVALRVQMTRLRHRVAALGLEINAVRKRGYIMERAGVVAH